MFFFFPDVKILSHNIFENLPFLSKSKGSPGAGPIDGIDDTHEPKQKGIEIIERIQKDIRHLSDIVSSVLPEVLQKHTYIQKIQECGNDIQTIYQYQRSQNRF